jgi:recombination protein RecA
VADHEARQPLRQMRLVELVAAAQRRWGARALVQGVSHIAAPAALATGLPPLDTLLDGGLPRGRLTEFLGTPTSGMTTIALQALAHTQARGEIGAFLDLRGTFDAGYAAACGVDLASLLLVRPKRSSSAQRLL